MSVLTGMLAMFVITLAIGHWIRKNKSKEVYDAFVINYGIGIAGLNFIAAGMIYFLTPFPLIERASHAFLPFLVGIVIMTLIKNNKK